MTVLCREGHASEEPDYCSMCGMAIPSGAPAVPASATPASPCPSCGEPREEPDARFCEVCRYDFLAQKPGPPPVARAVPNPSPPLSWELWISVDPTLDTDPDPAHLCPTGAPPIVLPVDRPDMLVGRHDDPRDIHPEISLRDPGASRRHAKIVLEPDGGVALQDLASTNGSQINGKDVPPGTRQRLAEGDQVTLGRWTRITLRGKR